MTYIELQDTFRRNKKIPRLARTLGIRRAEARGLITGLWTELLVQAPDGDLTSFDPEEVEEMADWEGDEGALYAALVDARSDGSEPRHRFIDRIGDRLVIHDWDEHTKGLQRAQYMRDYREKKKQAENSRVTHAKRTCDVLSDPNRSDPIRTEREERAPEPDTSRSVAGPTTHPALPPNAPGVPLDAAPLPTPVPTTGDAAQAQPGRENATRARPSESVPLVEAEVDDGGARASPPGRPRVTEPPADFDDVDDDLLDDTTGAVEAIAAWNAHRAEEIPPSPTNARGLNSAVLTTIRADRRAEREARHRGDTSPPPVPWLHRRSGWVALAERTRSADYVRLRLRKTAQLAWWVHEANRGGESGAMRREQLFLGAWDDIRDGAETAAERQIREGVERVNALEQGKPPDTLWAGLLPETAGRRR